MKSNSASSSASNHLSSGSLLHRLMSRGLAPCRARHCAIGLYHDHVLPLALNRMMDTKQTRTIRSRVCAELSGDVVEIGFGTGLNLPHLPSAVTALKAVDPMKRGRALARERLVASPVDVEFVGLDGQRIPLDDDSVDSALSTWTLCSIPDPVAAVREIRRVLRPGGTLRFVEHGRSPNARVFTWQQRLNPVQRRVAGGCTLDSDIAAIIVAGGLCIDHIDTYYASGEPKTHGWTFEGSAHRT